MEKVKPVRNLEKSLNIRISDSLFLNLKNISSQHGIVVSKLVRTVLERELGSYERLMVEVAR
jgi:predicted DNA binding CopG/RHH family protein